jgi:phosphonate transport system substrate-binding protein
MTNNKTLATLVFTALAATFFVANAHAQSCASRGELDALYCDKNGDLVADTPTATVNPSKLVLGISSVEDASTSRRTYSPLMDHLSVCLKKDIEMYPPVREGAVMDAQRTGVVHIGQYATGATMYAVNFAGGIVFAGKGREQAGRTDNYTLKLLVRADSAVKSPSELKGKRIAHTSASSNSGNLAPRALFPDLGLKPDVDYKVEFSGAHDKSIQGVKLGLYDGAAVASDVLERLIAKGEVKASDFKVVFESEPFPTDAFAMSHNLDLKLQGQIRKCFADFKFPEAMSRQLEGTNRFFPMDYKKDWSVVRQIAKASGNAVNAAGYQKILDKR